MKLIPNPGKHYWSLHRWMDTQSISLKVYEGVHMKVSRTVRNRIVGDFYFREWRTWEPQG